MKKSNLILLGAVVAIVFFSLIFQLSVHGYIKKERANQKPVEMVMEMRDTPAFTAISAKGRVKIKFEQDTTRFVQIHAPNYILDSLFTKVNESRLDIELGVGLKKKDSVLIHITNPSLNGILLHTNASFETLEMISGSNLELDFKDESSGKLELNYTHVTYRNTTTGSVDLKGEIANIKLEQNMNE